MGANGCHTEPKAKYPNEIVGFFATAQNDIRRTFAHDVTLFNRTLMTDYTSYQLSVISHWCDQLITVN